MLKIIISLIIGYILGEIVMAVSYELKHKEMINFKTFVYNNYTDRLIRADKAAEEFVSVFCPENNELLSNETNTNTCVCCGEEVPEGRMVCPKCETE